MTDDEARGLTEREQYRFEYGVGPDEVLARLYRSLEEIRDDADWMMREIVAVNPDAPRTPGEPWPPLSCTEWTEEVFSKNRLRRKQERCQNTD